MNRLPTELHKLILYELPNAELYLICQTNHYYHNICQNDKYLKFQLENYRNRIQKRFNRYNNDFYNYKDYRSNINYNDLDKIIMPPRLFNDEEFSEE